MYLTSCGDAVTLHELPTYSVKHVYMRKNAANNNVKSVSWNKNGSGVASVYSKKGFVEIVCWKEDGTTMSQTAKVLQATSACFMKTNTSYVGIGTKSGEIVIWDCNTNAKLHTFLGCYSPLNLIDFNVNDSLIAVATEPGTITIFRYKSGQKISTHDFPGLGVCSAIRFHPYKRGYLGGTSTNGSVAVWDLTLNKKIFTANKCHSAPCPDLVFSKVNKNFMTSIGYDKILLGHDLLQKEPAMKVQMEVPLTCLDMTSDGTTVALGTITGALYVYDLRASSSPLHVVNTYQQKVNRVAYSPEITSCSSLKFPVIQESNIYNLSDVLNSTGSLYELPTNSFLKSFDQDFMVAESGGSYNLEKLLKNVSNISHNFCLPNNNPVDSNLQESVNVSGFTSETSNVVQETNIQNVSSNSTERVLNTNCQQELLIQKDMEPLKMTCTQNENLEGDTSAPITAMSNGNNSATINTVKDNIRCGKTSTPTTQIVRPIEVQNLSKLYEDYVESLASDSSPYFNNISPIAYEDKPSIGNKSVGTMTDPMSFQIIKDMISNESSRLHASLTWDQIVMEDRIREAFASMQEKVETLTQKVASLTSTSEGKGQQNH